MRYTLTFLFVLVVLSVYGQSPVLYFRNLNTGNGLSHNKVNCILQDRRGFLWIGTDDGLNRYDGHRFQTYRHNADSSSVSGNIVTDLLEDKNGVLWISTADGGLTRYDYRLSPQKQFKQFKHSASDSSSIPGNIINALVEDKNGNLWLASSGQGLLRFDKERELFSEPIRRRARTILALAMDANGIIWGGREGGGLIKIDPKTLIYQEDERYRDVYAKMPHMVVAALYSDSRNDMWIGSWDKVIYKADIVTGHEQVYKPGADPFSFRGDDPLSFAEDNRKRMWIGGTYNGLYLYDRNSDRFHQYRHDPSREGSLADNRVNAIYIDRSGVVWVGTNRGISMHDPAMQQFTQTFLPPPAKGATLFDFIFDDNGEMMIGSSNGMYVRNADGTFKHHPLQYKGQQLAATKFYRDPVGGLYIGTNLTLFRYANASLTMLPNTEKDVVMGRIIESRIVSMERDTIDNHPVLFVIPFGHFVAYYDYVLNQWVHRRDTVRNILKEFNIKDNLVRKFYKSRDGTIWVATVKAGLGEWNRSKDPKIAYHYNIPGKKTSIGNDNIYDITEDSHGNLWVSTYGGGLHYYNKTTREFQHISASHNLAEGIQTDRRGNVWMIANGHLHKYDPYRKAYTTFQLPDAEKTGGVKGYIARDAAGRMYVSGLGYYISFHPDQVRDMLTQPPVFFTDFTVFNTSYSHLLFNKQIELRYNENFFSVEYAAPSYQAGYQVQYQHKLEGVDADWVNDAGKADYTNLDGGEYLFKVRATVKPGVWGNDFASVRIHIIPPFWKTWWFYAMCAAIVALIIYGIYRYRINELLKRQAIRNKIAQDLHDNVGSTLSSISVYSQVAKIYKQQEKSEALRDTLEKISSTSSEMISEMNDIVWAINPRNDNMETILQRMESFARPLLAARHIQFHFDYDDTVKQLVLEMTKRKNFYLIFKEAVNNALKYSECKNLWVNIHYRHHQLELAVKDDGKGFKTSKAKHSNSMSGNGLQNMQLRAKEMKGSWLIDSVEGEGTRINLVFPIP
jgi:ligand-binding sensor domain-containing protein/two-component sensor histidine kinase